jgi:DNA polymerase (family 10)
MAEVVKVARDHGVLLEINAQPDRLDLNDLHIRMAREAGVKLVIGTDAHRVEELDCMRYGVDQARRGWCEDKDVANARSLAAFRKLLAK